MQQFVVIAAPNTICNHIVGRFTKSFTHLMTHEDYRNLPAVQIRTNK